MAGAAVTAEAQQPPAAATAATRRPLKIVFHAKYAADGVEFQACHNALTEKKIAPASVPSGVKVVPAGVVALAEAQREGYAYIKP